MLRRILIADHEPPLADTMAAYLSLRGIEACTAYDGNQAVTTARMWRPHVFLTDAILPGIDGIEVARTVSRLLPECRVLLAVEGNWISEFRQRAHRVVIVEKPIMPEKLLNLLREWATSDLAA